MITVIAQASENINTVDTMITAGDFFSLMGLPLIFIAVSLPFIAFNIWMLIDCIKRKEADFPGKNKNLWTVLLSVSLIVSFLFSIFWVVNLVYYFIVKRKARSIDETSAPTQGTDTAAK